MKQLLVFFCACIFFLLIVVAPSLLINQRRNRIEAEYQAQLALDRANRLFIQNKYIYGSNIVRFHPLGDLWEEHHSDVVFVHTEDEVHDFPYYVKVMWPSFASLCALEDINYIIRTNEIDIELFELTYPITLENTVADWENVNTLVLRFNSSYLIRLTARIRIRPCYS